MAKHVVAGVVLALLALSALPAQAQLFSRDNAENADAGAVAAGKTGPKVTIVLAPVPAPEAAAPGPAPLLPPARDEVTLKLEDLRLALDPNPTLILIPFQKASTPLRTPLPQPRDGPPVLAVDSKLLVPLLAEPAELPELPELSLVLSAGGKV